MADFLWPRGLFGYWKSLLEWPEGRSDQRLVDFFKRLPSKHTVVVLEHNGNGAMDRVPESATAFGHRG